MSSDTLSQAIAGFFLGIFVFVAAGLLIYWVFYSTNNFDRHTGEGATAFKVGLWLAYGTHLVVSPLLAGLLTRWLGRPALAVALGATFATVLLAYPTLGMLNYWNNCIGMEYPLGTRACG
jgi:hypothetical protein